MIRDAVIPAKPALANSVVQVLIETGCSRTLIS